MKVTIVDYGAGNLQSIRNAVYISGHESIMGDSVKSILKAERLILPGVGAAATAIEQIRKKGFDEALEETVINKARPMLGICLGMQVLAENLFEHGENKGLGWIEGDVVKIDKLINGEDITVPHIGWNSLKVNNKENSTVNLKTKNNYYYFCHSYTLTNCDKDIIHASVSYGIDLVAAIQFKNIFATQFHPEKSQLNGIDLISSFIKWAP